MIWTTLRSSARTARGCSHQPRQTGHLEEKKFLKSEAKLFKDRWFHLDPPRHVSFFTKPLLSVLAKVKAFDSGKTWTGVGRARAFGTQVADGCEAGL